MNRNSTCEMSLYSYHRIRRLMTRHIRQELQYTHDEEAIMADDSVSDE